jgi:hypothetical protein
MVRDGSWKLIFSHPESKAKAAADGIGQRVLERIHPASRELYDLASDPRETANLAERHGEVADRLHRLYMERASSGTPMPEARPVDAETRERLRALGYTD